MLHAEFFVLENMGFVYLCWFFFFLAKQINSRLDWINKLEVNGFILDRVNSKLGTEWLCHLEKDVFVFFLVQAVPDGWNEINCISLAFWWCLQEKFLGYLHTTELKISLRGPGSQTSIKTVVNVRDFNLFYKRYIFFKWFGTFTLQEIF